MDKSFMIFVGLAVGALYFITNFIGDVQEDDSNYRNEGYIKAHKYDDYLGKDSIGRNILNLYNATPEVQVAAWNDSDIKKEYLKLFPNFEEMRKFIDERVNGKQFNQKLLKHLEGVETRFFAGKISAERAKVDIADFK